MRILICVQNYHPAYSFGGRVVKSVAMAEGLSRLGHEITVVTTSVIDRKKKSDFYTKKEIVNGVEVIYLGTWLKAGQASINPSVLSFAFSEVKSFAAVYIIGIYDALGPVIAWAARRNGAPYSVEPSGMLIPIVHSLRIKNIYHTVFGRPMLNGARIIFVTSKSESKEALSFGIPPEKISFAPNGINLEEFKTLPARGSFRKKFKIAEEVPLILWLGRIEKKKNIKQLFESLADLKDHSWILAIVGPSESADYLNSLKEFASELGIGNRVLFIPPIFDADKLAAYVDSDLFTLVSLNENWGNTVTEAIAAGVPVLVTNTCGVSEIVEGRAGLVVDCSREGIRNGLYRLLTEPVLNEKIKAELSGMASELSWDKKVHHISDVFKSW